MALAGAETFECNATIIKHQDITTNKCALINLKSGGYCIPFGLLLRRRTFGLFFGLYRTRINAIVIDLLRRGTRINAIVFDLLLEKLPFGLLPTPFKGLFGLRMRTKAFGLSSLELLDKVISILVFISKSVAVVLEQKLSFFQVGHRDVHCDVVNFVFPLQGSLTDNLSYWRVFDMLAA
jgi:hypothetical protein